MRKRMLLGGTLPVDNVTMEEVLQFVEDSITAGSNYGPKLIIAQNANKSAFYLNDQTFREQLDKADMLIPDGTAILISSKILGHRLAERVAGVDVMQEMLRIANRREKKVFFLGGSEEVSAKVAENIVKQFPEIVVAGAHSGFFSKEQETEIIKRINETAADFLFVAMGSPKQEKWLFENRGRINAKVCIGVGGSFDIIAGIKKRSPDILIKLKMEYAYRMFKEPKRLFRLKPYITLFSFTFLQWLKGNRKLCK